jgi:hypothetical protein
VPLEILHFALIVLSRFTRVKRADFRRLPTATRAPSKGETKRSVKPDCKAQARTFAGPRKVMAYCRGVKAGIYTAKEHLQLRRKHIRQGLAGRGDQLFLRPLERFADCHE